MLNKDKNRELTYLVYVDAIEPIPGKDRVEAAVIGGWKVMVHKGEFAPGDIGIYFEIDSKVPEREPFKFLEKYHYKIKTQKFKNFYSQGLLMHPNDFGWLVDSTQFAGGILFVRDADGNQHFVEDESRFLTKQLDVTYAVAEDNQRKAPSTDKYKKMAQRHPNIFSKSWARWMMKREWGKKIMFFFFGKAKDKKNGWPLWVAKTDEERVQNMPYIFTSEDWVNAEWIVTEKIDGSSTTFTMKVGKGFKKPEFYVCSRNVCFDTPEKSKNCYYDTNIYTEMAKKYDVSTVLRDLLQKNNLDFVTLQGETYGAGVQKRDYSLKEHQFAAFNLIFGYNDGTKKRFNSIEMKEILDNYNIPTVPILDTKFKLPSTCDELLTLATGASAIDKLPREGFVIRDYNGERSFKAVSNEFLAKYHQ